MCQFDVAFEIRQTDVFCMHLLTLFAMDLMCACFSNSFLQGPVASDLGRATLSTLDF